MGRDFTGDTIQESMPVMKASELRIGNLIKDRAKVVEVENHHFSLLESYHKEDFQPIPLTEEWLLKFGFETKDKVFWDVGNFRVGQDRWGGYDYVNRRVDIDLKYVHQLQNLYFALTGEELTIKE